HSLEVSVKASAAGLSLKPESVFLHGTIAELAAEHGRAEQAGGDARRLGDTAQQLNGRPVVNSGASGKHGAAPASSVPVVDDQLANQQTRNTVIESLGTYLPAEVVSTDSVLAGCANDIGIPLQRLTGISNRRMAGQGEFSIDLARHAVAD